LKHSLLQGEASRPMKRFLPYAACAFIFFGCGKCGFMPEKDVLAVVNGKCISKKDFSMKAKLYGVKVDGKKEAADFLNLLINDRLIIDRAKDDGIYFTRAELQKEIEGFVPGYTSSEIKRVLRNGEVSYGYWLKDLKEKILRKKEINFVMKNRINIEEREIKDYFWTNIINFRRVHKVKARQIVVEHEEEAEEIAKLLKKGADFAALAKERSITTEAKEGGDLGFFSKKDMPVFITRVVFNMKKGAVSGIVKSPYGFHIFKCEDIALAETPKFEAVKEEVYEKYFEEKKDSHFSTWMEEIRREADIEIFEKNMERMFEEAKT